MGFKPRQGDEVVVSNHPKLRPYNYLSLKGVVKGYIKKRREVVVQFEVVPSIITLELEQGSFKIRRRR